MSQPPFDTLRERLLRAGIAPRHVRRYIGELRNHYDDLAREERANGLLPDEAEAAATHRLGSNEALEAAMLARPGMRSLTARFPWAVFGVGPLVLPLVLLVLGGFIDIAMIRAAEALELASAMPSPVAPAWLKVLVASWNTLLTYGLPLLLAALVCVVGARQRVRLGWIAAGAAIACIAGGGLEIAVHWGSPGTPNELSIGSALAPPFQTDNLARSMLRCAVNLALVAGAYGFWLRRRSFIPAG